MRSLAEYLADQKKRAADDRDLTSRSDLRKARKETEEVFAELARDLCDCSDKRLRQLELPEPLLTRVHDARRIESPSAKDRALRLVRRELRSIDANAIRHQLEEFANPRRQGALTPVEQWHNRMLEEPEAALLELLKLYPLADRQQLRQLVRNVRKADDAHRRKANAALVKCLSAVIRAGSEGEPAGASTPSSGAHADSGQQPLRS